MTADEVVARARQGKLVLLLDTNVLFGNRRLLVLCKRVNRLNRALGAEHGIRMFVSAAAHAEKLFDLKQEHRDAYDEDRIARGLRLRGLAILPFEERHARCAAVLLGSAYPTSEAWHRAKRNRCLHCLGLSSRESAIEPTGTGQGCGATIDWLIAAHAIEEGCVLVTDDGGVEFELVKHKLRLQTLEEAITAMLEDVAMPAPQPDISPAR